MRHEMEIEWRDMILPGDVTLHSPGSAALEISVAIVMARSQNALGEAKSCRCYDVANMPARRQHLKHLFTTVHGSIRHRIASSECLQHARGVTR